MLDFNQSPIDLALTKRLLFVTGKGGIGKTVIAASLALEANQRGKKVFIVQQSAKDHIGPLFGKENIGHELIEVLPGLCVANFNVGGNFRDFITKHLRHGSLFDVIAGNKVLHSFFKAIPGFGELMLLGRLYYTLNLAPEKPDLVIVDGYSSGHFQSLMTTPEAVLKSGLGGPILTETKRVEAFLANSRDCGVILVGVPEELVVTEMVELLGTLDKKSPTKVIGIVFNRCLERLAGEQAQKTPGPSSDFLDRRRLAQSQAWALWTSLSQKLSLGAIPVFKVPELGFIDDPLTPEIAKKLVAGGGV